MSDEKVDVVIVGAGASGSVYASVLAKAGKKVVLLESGPDWELSDLISSEIWGRRIKPAGAPILLEGKNPMAYAVLRADAVDVVYGTMEGYQALGIPYMAHIAPDRRW